MIAVDCEMVGVGPGGTRSSIARVCVINDHGNVLIDAFVQQKEKVTDYRTWVSGIKPEHLLRGEDRGKPLLLLSIEETQKRVAELFKGRVLVGHSLQNDLKALLLDHPRKETRDTAKYPPLMRSPAPGRKPRARALRHLALEELGITIQKGEHTPVDDARAALYVYHKHRKEWERSIDSGSLRRSQVQARADRKELREELEARALGGGGGDGEGGGGGGEGKNAKALARRARLGMGKGQVALAKTLANKKAGIVDVYTREAREDPMADL